MTRPIRQMATKAGGALFAMTILLAVPGIAAADTPKSPTTFQASDSAGKAIRTIHEERIKNLLNKAPVYPETVSCLSSGTPLWSCYDNIIKDKRIVPVIVSGSDILQTNASEGIAQVFMINRYDASNIFAITTKGRVLEAKDESVISAAHDLAMFKEAGVPYVSMSIDSYWVMFLRIIPILFDIFMIFMLIIVGIMQGKQIVHFFSNPATRMNADKIVPFSEIAGNDYVKKELLEISEAVKSNDEVMLAAIPSGLLMSGPPGCGKTMMAAAFAKECGLPFYHVAGSDFVEMFVGLGARRVSIMFKRLRSRHKVSVLFIDEIDSIGRIRSGHGDVGSSEHENTLNKMLQMMDGASNKTAKRRRRGRIIVIAATNRPDILDPALLRPERLERTVAFQLPPQHIREQIAAIYMRSHSFASDVSAKMIAMWTPGFSGAEIKSLINQALIQSGRERSPQITASHITHAIDLHLMGEPSQVILSDDDRAITAWHEGAHAMIAMMFLGAERVRSITILPRGQALGMVAMTPPEGRYSQSLDDLIGSILVSVAGRAGELIHENGRLERVTTGAAQDIVQASDVARDIIERFGFTPLTGMSTHTFVQGHPRYGRSPSEKRSAEIDDLVTSIVSNAFDQARAILTANSKALEHLAATLLEKGTITGIDAWKAISPLISHDDGKQHAIDVMTGIISAATKTTAEMPAETRLIEAPRGNA